MSEPVYGADVPLTIMMPAGLMRQLAIAASHDLRQPEAEALWLIREGLGRMDGRMVTHRTAKGRREIAAPLFDALAAAYTEAKRPSTRQVAAQAREAGHSISHTTVHDVLLSRQRVPTWRAIEALAAGLGTDPARFKTAWERAHE